MTEPDVGEPDVGMKDVPEENIVALYDDVEESEQANAPFQRKKRGKTSSVWDNIEIIQQKYATKIAKCIHCHKKLSVQATGATSHYIRHLKTCDLKKSHDSKQQTLQLQPKKSKVEMPIMSSGKYDQGKQREAITHWILMHGKPFSVVEEIGFSFMMGINQPMFEKNTRYLATKDCFSVYESEKKKLKNVLKQVSKVSLTTDVWKSKVKKISFMCVTGHFVDSDWTLQKRVLSFVEFPPPHTGIEIANVLSKCIKEWGIEGKIFTISVDNASSNDMALNIMKETLVKSGQLHLQGQLFHVRCCDHIVNLIAQDGYLKLRKLFVT